MAKIRAVLKHPGKKPVVMLIDNSIDSMERQVEGVIGHQMLGDGTAILYNRNANKFDHKRNMRFRGTVFLGKVVFVAVKDDQFASLTDDQAEALRRELLK